MSSGKQHKRLLRVHVDAISDFACPWCYVGAARLQAAIDAQVREQAHAHAERAHGEATGEHSKKKTEEAPHVALVFSVSWQPYIIDPGTLIFGEDYVDYNRRRWGNDGWVTGLKREAIADPESGSCKFAGWGRQLSSGSSGSGSGSGVIAKDSKWVNSMNVHRCMLFFRLLFGTLQQRVAVSLDDLATDGESGEERDNKEGSRARDRDSISGALDAVEQDARLRAHEVEIHPKLWLLWLRRQLGSNHHHGRGEKPKTVADHLCNDIEQSLFTNPIVHEHHHHREEHDLARKDPKQAGQVLLYMQHFCLNALHKRFLHAYYEGGENISLASVCLRISREFVNGFLADSPLVCVKEGTSSVAAALLGGGSSPKRSKSPKKAPAQALRVAGGMEVSREKLEALHTQLETYVLEGDQASAAAGGASASGDLPAGEDKRPRPGEGEVKLRDAQAKERGVGGVPFFRVFIDDGAGAGDAGALTEVWQSNGAVSSKKWTALFQSVAMSASN